MIPRDDRHGTHVAPPPAMSGRERRTGHETDPRFGNGRNSAYVSTGGSCGATPGLARSGEAERANALSAGE